MIKAFCQKQDNQLRFFYLLAHSVDPVLHVEGEEGPVHVLLRALAGQMLVIGLVVTSLGLAQRQARRRRIGGIGTWRTIS